MSGRRYCVIGGGGTGGHVFEALAIARALEAAGHAPDEILLIGSRRGQESTLLADEPFEVRLLPGRGILRGWGPRALLQNLGAAAGLAWASVLAVSTLLRHRPRVVVSVGGYASFPAASAAVLLRVPLVLVNIDAVPGLVHRLFGRLAAASAVAFPDTPLPRTTVTGTAVRDEILGVDRSMGARVAARGQLGLPSDRQTIGIFGGSLGARRLNEAARELVDLWNTRADRTIYHVTGQRGWDSDDGADAVRQLSYRRVPFENNMPLLYEAADVVVCRSGAVTVAEITAAGVPAILVPLPGAPGDHQGANAAALGRAGAGVLLADDACTGTKLAAVLDELLDDPLQLESMGVAATSLARPDAAARVAALVVSHAR